MDLWGFINPLVAGRATPLLRTARFLTAFGQLLFVLVLTRMKGALINGAMQCAGKETP